MKLGIVKGVAHTLNSTGAAGALAKRLKCPVCGFNPTEVDKSQLTEEEKNMSVSRYMARHVKQCLQSRYPNYKSKCSECGAQLLISELDEHLEKIHGIREEDLDDTSESTQTGQDMATGVKSESGAVQPAAPLTNERGS